MTSPTRRAVLAIDPGRSKCGVAIVDDTGYLVHQAIVPADECVKFVTDLVERVPVMAAVLGDGTGSDAIRDALAEAIPALPIEVVDEHHTSEEARARRVAQERHGWRRLVPAGLLTPKAPYDDIVAAILAERWWRAQREKHSTSQTD